MPFVTDSGVWRSLVDEGSRCTVSHRLSTFAFVHPHMQSLSFNEILAIRNPFRFYEGLSSLIFSSFDYFGLYRDIEF